MQNNLVTKEYTSKILLEWYQHFGVDECLSDQPCNWYEISEKNILQQKTVKATQADKPKNEFTLQPKENKKTVTKLTPLPPDNAVQTAKERAKSATSIEDLEKAIREFNNCALKSTAKNTCISRGNPHSNLMLIGEAPGRDEDLQGIPFVGRAGQLLDKMMAAIGLNDQQFYITNIVYWRPPGNRTPTPHEAETCRPFLERQIELIQPDCILLLGGAAAKSVLNTTSGIMRMRGKWQSITLGSNEFKTMATLHPAYLLRSPAAKKMAWKDLLNLKSTLEAIKEK